MRIVKPDTAFRPGKNTAPVKRDDYRKWIKTLPCMGCRKHPSDPAHLSMDSRSHGHLGRGKAKKASDRWVLPLCRSCHHFQHHVGEADFWNLYRDHLNPHLACLVIWGLWSDYGEDATEMATELIMKGELG